ncbi:hypothetical protein RJ639_009592 [Escallonia herrerae]|uniref:Uncharacterized protein n=1 Tax=Escallonia herrerae TaxID=1293975 RepID=A0AA88VQ67_9ASTE|nr:hypothetical protein RJ639_009592 [Escallonia herrerae]
MNHAKSMAYIGFGNVATPPPNELVALAGDTPFLWSLKESFMVHLPQGFLEMIAHGSIGVLINHCGFNSVLESIAAGVPVVGRPFFGDHQLDSWMVKNEWKIGVRIRGGGVS